VSPDLSVALCAALPLAFSIPLWVRCSGTDRHWSCESVAARNSETDDARQFAMMWEVSRVSIGDFGELPSWNPYHCGGVIHYLDPQVPFPGPLFFLLFFWLPAVPSIKVWNLLHLIAGALGMRKLVKDHGGNLPEQLLAASLVVGCGAVAQHLGGGQLWFTPFLLMPWVLWTWERALDEPRWAVLLAAIFALAVLEGGVYPVPLMLVALVFDALPRLWRREERRQVLVAGGLLAVLFPLLAGVKLVPVLHFLRGIRRLVPLDDRMTLGEVIGAWTTREHPREMVGHVYVWPEYDSYVGIVPVILLVAAVAAAFVARGDEVRPMRLRLWLLAALLWCALGDVPRLSVFGALHKLPIFASLRVPSRFLYPATVVAALLIALLLVRMRAAIASRARVPWIPRAVFGAELVLAVFVAADVFLTTAPRLQQGADARAPRARASSNFHLVANASWAQVPDFPIRGIGTTECYGGFDWPVSRALWKAGPQQRLEPAAAGSVERLRWGPSSITFHAALSRPGTLVVDQNFDRGWQATEGTPVPRDGLLALELAAGDREVRLLHRPQGFWLGLGLSIFGLLLSAAAWRGLTRTSAPAGT
jgi:hypothetical protein